MLRARSVRALRPWWQARSVFQFTTNAAKAAAPLAAVPADAPEADEAVRQQHWNEHLVDLFTRKDTVIFPDSAQPALFNKVRAVVGPHPSKSTNSCCLAKHFTHTRHAVVR
jgi:hypothetical protein